MNHSADFIKAITSPDRRYGEVPFYWWNGGELNKKRISDQIRMLAEKGLAGVQVNYAHINGGGENNLPHGGHGKSIPGSPEQFSEEWWEFFSFAARECEKYGMSIGMGDYTIAWIGNGYFTDKVASMPGMHAKNLSCENKLLFSGDEASLGDEVLFAVTYEDFLYEKPVLIYDRSKGVLNPVRGMCEAFIISVRETENSIDPLNPDCGRILTEIYFKEFERRIPDLKPGTLNYFFQDELMFGADTKTLWSEALRDGIREKYGYDIAPFLPHLFFNLGNITPKIRLDIADVRTEIIERCYFIPIYEYHSSRGLIYGCDQSSRGKEPDEFSDYFRTVRWFTAPGNDTPGRAADLIKVKVNSSIAHLYNRPRVWLEGYHSSGWGTTLESITAPTSDNFIFGANLLNLHGLYYSTDGGFFEWAPPDFHFRMPYWDDEKSWLDKYKRLSQLLTTGSHCCDIAIYYPVSSCDYGENNASCVKTTFECAEFMFNNGADFDFIDFQSVEMAVCRNEKLYAGAENYKVLIFAGVDCVRYSAVRKAKEFLDNGGCVVFCGITPYASDRAGLNDSVLQNDFYEMLKQPGCILAASPAEALSFINKRIKRSFLPEITEDEKAYVHKRTHGEASLFFVRYAKKGSVCRFEAEGIPYLLDTDTGKVTRLLGTTATEGFSFVRMPLEGDRDTLLLFTYDEIPFDSILNTEEDAEEEIKEEIILDGYWDFSLIPTLDNTYGDYYIPGGGRIGAQARFFDTVQVKEISSFPESYRYYSLPFCRSEAIRRISGCDDLKALAEYISANKDITRQSAFTLYKREYKIETPVLHDRYMYKAYDYRGSLFEQGHHGLKGRVYDDNIIFSSDSLFFTYVYSPEDSDAFIKTGSILPEFIMLNGDTVKKEAVHLKKGKNLLLAAYKYDNGLAPDYRNNCETKRTSLYITNEKPSGSSYRLSASSFANPDYFRFSDNPDINGIFCFRFMSVPGFEGMSCNLFGELLSAYNNREKADIEYLGTGNFGGNQYRVSVNNTSPDISEVIFFVKPREGYEYTGIIPEPAELFCTKGRLRAVNLAECGSLISFSGKAVYEKDFTVRKKSCDDRVILDIEDAAATVNVSINGKTAAVFTYHPFTADITEHTVNGSNHIKITVSNTLCNHYSTIPSRYSNFPRDSASGLMGDVKIRIITAG